jgi:hypothetical protein
VFVEGRDEFGRDRCAHHFLARLPKVVLGGDVSLVEENGHPQRGRGKSVRRGILGIRVTCLLEGHKRFRVIEVVAKLQPLMTQGSIGGPGGGDRDERQNRKPHEVECSDPATAKS